MSEMVEAPKRAMRRYHEDRTRRHWRHLLRRFRWMRGEEPSEDWVVRMAHGHRWRVGCPEAHCEWCAKGRTHNGRRRAEAAREEIEAFT